MSLLLPPTRGTKVLVFDHIARHDARYAKEAAAGEITKMHLCRREGSFVRCGPSEWGGGVNNETWNRYEPLD